MRAASALLVRDSLAKWVRTPGLLMVLAVALVPVGLTGAWVYTHQDDIQVSNLEWDIASPESGQMVNFTVTVNNEFAHPVGPFNVTVRVGYYERNAVTEITRWRDVHNETVPNVSLPSKGSTAVTVNWTTEPGSFQVEAYADFFEDVVPEIEERNNYRPAQIQVRYPVVRPQIQTPAPANNSTDDARPVVDAALSDLTWSPSDIFERDNVTFSTTVMNNGPGNLNGATVLFQVHQLTLGGLASQVVFDTSEMVNVSAGESVDVSFQYDRAARGLFAAFAYLDASAVARGDNDTDNAVVQQFDVLRRLVWEEPDAKATAKDFYQHEILFPVHFTLLVPLLGLFYAGGVLQDDRSRGNLVYTLTRSVPRWQLPLVRFAASYGIALLAVLVGVVLTYLLLLGTPQDNAGFFWWPLAFGALALLLYASVFTAVGVISDRPYLVGLVYLLGFETMLIAGSRILVNGAPLVQEWVLRFSLNHWIGEAYAGWDPTTSGLLPETGAPLTAVFVIIGISIASLALAVWVVKRREFVD